jgi:hypothetical protein
VMAEWKVRWWVPSLCADVARMRATHPFLTGGGGGGKAGASRKTLEVTIGHGKKQY